MNNGKSIRLLISWILAAAVVTALGTDALASKYVPPSGSTSVTASSLKPPIRPFSGEPDQTDHGPLPPKVIPTLTSTGGSNFSVWALRNVWAIRVVLVSLPNRIP